jgi:RecG-like helicase
MCFLATKDHFRFQIKKQKSEDLHLERASAIARLTTMISTNDGFQIAEADMKLRGPGDIMGTRQSGIPKFLFIDLINDSEIIEHSKKTAELIIEQDPQLRLPHHSVIRNEYERLRMSDTFFMNIA